MAKDIAITIYRYDPSKDQSPRYETYKVPYIDGMRAIDGLLSINEKYASNIAFRYECKEFLCGSCSAMINGKQRLLCKYVMKPGEKITIDPLAGFPVIRDIVVDRSRVANKFKKIEPYPKRAFPKREVPGKPEAIPNYPQLEPMWRTFTSCIECQICHSTCPMVEVASDEFAGPSILLQIARLAWDPRDTSDREQQAFFEGVYHCTTCSRCEELCPREIKIPHKIIEGLREKVAGKRYGPYEPHKKFAELALNTGRVVERVETPLLEQVPEWSRVKNTKDRVGFFTGCLRDYRLQDSGKALIKVLNKQGVDVYTPHAQICCSSPLIRTGQWDKVKVFIEKNVNLFESAGIDKVVTGCAGCGMTMKKNWPEYLGRKPEFRAMDITEYLTEIGLNKADMQPLNMKVTYHDPCHLRVGQAIPVEIPRELIKSIPGVKLKEMTHLTDCCGGGGGLRSGRRDLADILANRRVAEALKTGADAVISVCPFCEISIMDAMMISNAEKKPTVMSLVQFLDMAYTKKEA